jgi:hypothetical protein
VKSPIAAAIAISVGLIILLGYFLTLPVLDNVRSVLLDWAVILAAVATWIGAVNLISTHARKINNHKPDMPYSVVLIAAFVITLAVGIFDLAARTQSSILDRIVNSIQFPVESSLMALLTVSLAYASIRLLQRRRNVFTITFFVSVIVFLLLSSGLLSLINSTAIPPVVAGLGRLPVAGARGILIGIALGSLTTGVRVLTGSDRPYGS